MADDALDWAWTAMLRATIIKGLKENAGLAVKVCISGGDDVSAADEDALSDVARKIIIGAPIVEADVMVARAALANIGNATPTPATGAPLDHDVKCPECDGWKYVDAGGGDTAVCPTCRGAGEVTEAEAAKHREEFPR